MADLDIDWACFRAGLDRYQDGCRIRANQASVGSKGLHSQGDIAILAVNQLESATQVRGYAELYHLHFSLLLDSEGAIGHLYRVEALPTTVFIDRTGIVKVIHIGGPMTYDFIESQLQSLVR